MDHEMYADDSCISVTGDDTAVIKAQLEENAQLISTWLQVNRLALSPEKTEFMLVGGKRESKITRNEQHTITVGGNEINQKSYIKLLGIILDNDLTFSSYLNGTKDKEHKGLLQTLANRIWLLNRMRKKNVQKIHAGCLQMESSWVNCSMDWNCGHGKIHKYLNSYRYYKTRQEGSSQA